MVEPGTPCPRFKLLGHDGQSYGPRSFGRKKVALVFFPMDLSEDVTAFLQAFRSSLSRYFSLGLVPVGVSSGTPEVLSKLRRELQLPFILLSDPEFTLAGEFGVQKDGNDLKPAVAVLAEDTTLMGVLRNLSPEQYAESVAKLVIQ